MIERWSRDQVLALAPDAASGKAAQGVAGPGRWPEAGASGGVVWGACKGSGATPYQACADLSAPAYRCGCPSRKFPCKHVLGLLLLWSAGGVRAAAPPGWVEEWLAARRDRAAARRAGTPAGSSSGSAAGPAAGPAAEGGEPGAEPGGAAGQDDGPPRGETGREAQRSGEAARRAAQRERRVSAGLSELERWLADQIRQGIAATRTTGFDQWDGLAKRLIDAQAPGVAGRVSRLASLLPQEEWPSRVLEQYALLHLLAVGHRRAPSGHMGATIRSRIGFPVTREEVLAGERVQDEWHVLGARDDMQDRLVSRRVWLRGAATGRAALVLSFAPPGQPLDASLVTGTAVRADLAFYPGACPLRALVAGRHGLRAGLPPPAATLDAALSEVAAALAGDPWLDSWPVVLGGVVPVRGDGWLLGCPAAGPEGPAEVAGWGIDPAIGAPWRLVSASGGRPLTVAAEWTPKGLVPLTAWGEDGEVIVL
ncbi:hypothetical protein Misp01_69560 [Microtetraspora sp. NBRC 13810]|uniref:SWIM zinc finger family protein n=1 Tax=Microtetraspora sp. NBRC 13810 TaxID=3030990 RepID=UPI0024A2A220|nr:SWIM zinc finger family protein [Microtetraspora sp. NBRC 13810]GLW11828.1 hypothetical protein Misp01_69560 [Microtetraspora sp. NBRC 13810]